MANEQQGVSSASAGGAPAPKLDRAHLLAEEWGHAAGKALAQFLNACSTIDSTAEILPADRKPVYDQPGVDMDWDEDDDAMVVHGVGWSLSWGCKLSVARDHDTGEHYVCVNEEVPF